MSTSHPGAPSWMYDERRHCGVDYDDKALAGKYDDSHQTFRDVDREFAGMMRLLELDDPGSLTALDLGCGTGLFTRLLAGAFARVHAVDISGHMLDLARKKSLDLPNVTLHQAGFLTYVHTDIPVDVIISKMAFHHLPDFWKQVALLRLNGMLSMRGLLYFHDVVFGFAPETYRQSVDAWIDAISAVAGETIRREMETHIRDEHSTFDWILEGMLTRAGFVTEKRETRDGFVTEYVCRKVHEVGKI